MSLENLRLLNLSTVNSEKTLKWAVSPIAWENEKLEFHRCDGGFECKDGKKLLIYGIHTSLFAYC
jgi:hypothetical protein